MLLCRSKCIIHNDATVDAMLSRVLLMIQVSSQNVPVEMKPNSLNYTSVSHKVTQGFFTVNQRKSLSVRWISI